MKNYFTRILMKTITLGIVFILTCGILQSQVEKVVLLEQHTGAWCGWCVDGTVKMDEILAKYPKTVIGVKIHNGDKMVIAEQAQIAQALGLTGYPTGSVDRAVFNVGGQGAIFLSRTAWMQACEAVLTAQAKVGVSVMYSLNEATRELSATISADFVSAVSGDVRFNLYICEDDVSGLGTGWDQSNYLSGRAGYENNPYYTKPNPIVGYKHMKVVRAMLGGAWGTQGSIAGSPTAGSKYNYGYTYTIPAEWKTKDIWVVGVIQMYDASNAGNRAILNSCVGVQGTPSTDITTVGKNIDVAPQGTTKQLQISIKNISTQNNIYTWKLEKSARTPGDWTSVLEDNVPAEFTVAPNETKTVTLKFTPGATVGAGDATVTFSEKYKSNAFSYSQKLTIYSEEIDALQIVSDDASGQYSLAPNFTAIGRNGVIDAPSAEFIPNMNLFTNLKTVIWTGGEECPLTGTEATAIQDLIMAKKVNCLLSGTMLSNKLSALTPNILTLIGARYLGVCRQGATTADVSFIGYPNDLITDGYSQPGKLIKYLTMAISVTGANTFPILRHQSVDTIIACRAVINNGTRVVLLGLNPYVITNLAARNDLVRRCLNWLEGNGPEISFDSKTMDYGEVEVDKYLDKVITIENKGKQPLVITEMAVDYSYQNVFKVQGVTLPVTIQPSGTLPVTIRFTPADEIDYDTKITFTSNAGNGATQDVSLIGKGIESTTGPQISLSTNKLSFPVTSTSGTTEMTLNITNSGTDNLSITKLEVQLGYDKVFELPSIQYPITIVPGGTQPIKIIFKPLKDVVYTAILTITSNSNKNNVLTMTLEGEGTLGGAVGDEPAISNAPVSLAVGPNPFDGITTIKYRVNGNVSKQVELIVIDAQGKLITGLVNKLLSPGEYNVEFNARKLASGAYFVVGKVGEFTARVPIALVK